MAAVTPDIVAKALKLVFGSKSKYADLRSLRRLDRGVLKSAYREKAMYFHPDRAQVLGLDENILSELFKRLHGAYRLLNRVLVDESLLAPATEPAHSVGRRYFHGRVPEKKLRFAQFLYYNGLIDWQSMIDAVTWQMQVRPKIGEIGRVYQFFDHSGILSIIRERERTELFGGAALRLGMVNLFQLNAMVGKQRSLNYPIGRFFLEKGIFSSRDMETLLLRSKHHNRCHS